MGRLNDAHALAVSVLRGGRGLFVRYDRPPERDPVQLLELYEFEACPYCRKVREVMSELDIEYIERVMPKRGGKRAAFRERTGREMFPYLVDPNTDTKMFESEDIIDHLHKHYGPGRASLWRLVSPLNSAASTVASAWRPIGRRTDVSRSEQPAELLVLYNFEASPYCRKVREVLNQLDLDHHIRNVAKNSRRRKELIARGGKMMVPYLIDPNSDTEMYESDDIVQYLQATYG